MPLFKMQGGGLYYKSFDGEVSYDYENNTVKVKAKGIKANGVSNYYPIISSTNKAYTIIQSITMDQENGGCILHLNEVPSDLQMTIWLAVTSKYPIVSVARDTFVEPISNGF